MSRDRDFWELFFARQGDGVDYDVVPDAGEGPPGWYCGFFWDRAPWALWYGRDPDAELPELFGRTPDPDYPLEWGDAEWADSEGEGSDVDEGFVGAALRRRRRRPRRHQLEDFRTWRLEALLGAPLQVVNLRGMFPTLDFSYDEGPVDGEEATEALDVHEFFEEAMRNLEEEERECIPHFVEDLSELDDEPTTRPSGAFVADGRVRVVWGDRLYRLGEWGLVEEWRLPGGLTPLFVREGALVFRVAEDEFLILDAESGRLVDPQAVTVPIVVRLAEFGMRRMQGDTLEVLEGPTGWGPIELSGDGRAYGIRHQGERRLYRLGDGHGAGPYEDCRPHASWIPGFGWTPDGRTVRADDEGRLFVGLRLAHRLAPGAARIDTDGRMVVTCAERHVEVVELDARGRVAKSEIHPMPARVRFAHAVSCRQHADPDGGYIGTLFEMLGDNERGAA